MAKARKEPSPPAANAISTVAARDNLSEVLNRAAYGKERVILTRRGKALAAVVPIEDVALLEEIEDQRDAAAFRAAKKAFEQSGQKAISWEEIKRAFGL